MGEGSPEEFVLPVAGGNSPVVFNTVGSDSRKGVFVGWFEVGVGVAGDVIDFCLEFHEIIAVHQFHFVCNLIHCPGCAEIHLRFAFLTLFGGDDNHTVGSSCSVDCGCRCILENVD